MSITLDIPEGLVTEPETEAQRHGLPLSDYLVALLATGRAAKSAVKSGAELVAYWREEGIVGCRPDIADSQAHANEVRRQAEQRVRDSPQCTYSTPTS
jgi:hypothetical protein